MKFSIGFVGLACAAFCLVPRDARAQSAPPPPEQAQPAPAPQQAAPPQPAPAPQQPGYAYPPGYAPPPPAYAYPPPAYAYPPPAYAYPPPAYGAPPPGYAAPPPYVYPQQPPPPPRLIRRDGLTFGGALGPGGSSGTSCSTCGGGLATDLHIGVNIHYRVALLADFYWVYRSYDASGISGRYVTTNNLFIAGAGQFWVLNRIWLRAGVGHGSLHRTNWNGLNSTATALAYIWGIGLEVFQASTFALDLQYVGGFANYSGVGVSGVANNAFLVGLNWY